MNEKERFQSIQVTGYRLQARRVTRFLPGITLVELVTSIAILGVLSLMIGSVYLAHFRLFSSQSASIDTSAQNKIAIEEISNQIRESNGVVDSCLAQNPCGGHQSGNSKLVLQLWPLNASGAPFDPTTNAPDYIVYRLNDPPNNNNFVKTVYPNLTIGSTRKVLTNKILASNVQTLSFLYVPAVPGTSEVTVTLTTQPKNSKETQFTQTVKVYLRNKI